MDNKTFKGKTEQEHYADMDKLKHQHHEWRKEMHGEKSGFFPLFSNPIKPYLKDISGNAIRLFMYLGIHSNNDTGEVIGVNLRVMEQFFDCKLRTLQNWLEELESAHLIQRIQPKFKGTSRIFLIPYSVKAYTEWQNERRFTTEQETE